LHQLTYIWLGINCLSHHFILLHSIFSLFIFYIMYHFDVFYILPVVLLWIYGMWNKWMNEWIKFWKNGRGLWDHLFVLLSHQCMLLNITVKWVGDIVFRKSDAKFWALCISSDFWKNNVNISPALHAGASSGRRFQLWWAGKETSRAYGLQFKQFWLSGFKSLNWSGYPTCPTLRFN
jgi:hypothetical protein